MILKKLPIVYLNCEFADMVQRFIPPLCSNHTKPLFEGKLYRQYMVARDYEKENTDKIVNIEDCRMGIEVIKPDVNESQMTLLFLMETR